MSNVDVTEKQPPQASGSDVLTKGLRERTKPDTLRRALAFKVAHVLLSLLFLWFFVIHLTGLYFFTKGFLLTRLVFDDKSECGFLPNGSPSVNTEKGCWHPRTFDRAVVIVIDALRYDFAVPFHSSGDNSIPRFYHNNFPLMHELAVKRPEQAILLPFIADPPTTTLQRLKALTAGNLPTFIDIGSSFTGQETEEDNVLVQMKGAGKSIVHLGDDTWHSLFPGYFHENLTHAYDSFNVWDLHTVDNGVIEHIFPLLDDKSLQKWDVVFAHLLGVDHAGHRYGPDHPAMAEKLQQMDRMINDIVQRIDDDTLLVVMGDHGMDWHGDHGGESDDEVEATLWMYSSKPRFGRLNAIDKYPPRTAKERPVQQIDFSSTLSLLLGLPVPFNNLGTPISEAFVKNVPANQADEINLATVNILVQEQIQRYQDKYITQREIDADSHASEKHQELTELRNQLKSKKTAAKNTEVPYQKLNSVYRDWHQSTIAMYRSLWANFVLSDMLAGVSGSVLGLVALVMLSSAAGPNFVNELPRLLQLAGGGLLMGALSSVPFMIQNSKLDQIVQPTGPLFLGMMGSAVSVILSRLPRVLRIVAKSGRPTIWGILAFLFTVSQAGGFASNSYTIHEDTILLFFLTSFGAVALLSSLRQADPADRYLGAYHSILFMFLTRAASYSRLCREEQMPGCRSSFYASQTTSTSAPWQLLIGFVVALLLPEVIKAFYRGTASYAASASFWIGFSFRMGLLLVGLYWMVDAADDGNWLAEYVSSSTLKTTSITLARCVLAIAVPVGLGTFVWAKPCIDISLYTPPVPDPVASGPVSAPAEPPRPQITILGYANVFGTRYFILLPVLVLTFILVLPPMGQYSLAICTWQILSLLEILDTNGLIINASSRSSIGPVVLAMLGSYHFFKTGHQAALSSIQWNAAFVPLRTIRYPWSPLLVVFNTFGAQILCACAVPLTVLWKRPVNSRQGLTGIWDDVLKAIAAHMLYYTTIQVATTMWAGHLRRHLMLYRVFMPRFLMASIVLVITDVVLVGVCFTAVRITGGSVAEVFGY